MKTKTQMFCGCGEPIVPALHTDSLLRKHHLLLKVTHDGQVSLVDWQTQEPVSRRLVLEYLQDLDTNPGFPGSDVAQRLREESI